MDAVKTTNTINSEDMKPIDDEIEILLPDKDELADASTVREAMNTDSIESSSEFSKRSFADVVARPAPVLRNACKDDDYQGLEIHEDNDVAPANINSDVYQPTILNEDKTAVINDYSPSFKNQFFRSRLSISIDDDLEREKVDHMKVKSRISTEQSISLNVADEQLMPTEAKSHFILKDSNSDESSGKQIDRMTDIYRQINNVDISTDYKQVDNGEFIKHEQAFIIEPTDREQVLTSRLDGCEQDNTNVPVEQEKNDFDKLSSSHGQVHIGEATSHEGIAICEPITIEVISKLNNQEGVPISESTSRKGVVINELTSQENAAIDESNYQEQNDINEPNGEEQIYNLSNSNNLNGTSSHKGVVTIEVTSPSKEQINLDISHNNDPKHNRNTIIFNTRICPTQMLCLVLFFGTFIICVFIGAYLHCAMR